MSKFLFTSESVTEGHPDKICDQISDAILDAILEKDPGARVACETTCYHRPCPRSWARSPPIAMSTSPVWPATSSVTSAMTAPSTASTATPAASSPTSMSQSPDIALGEPTIRWLAGAGDQGMMFGYACDETPELMPLPISLAHKLAKRLTEVRKNGTLDYLRPDGKSQVTVEYDDGKPVRIDAVVISSPAQRRGQPWSSCTSDILERGDQNRSSPPSCWTRTPSIYINPTGRFVVGGPQGDTGLTGRKIIVDTYGGYCPPRRRCFLRQGPHARSTVQRAYAARWVAKNIVAAGLAKQVRGASWPTPSAWPSRSPSWWILSAPALWPTRRSRPLWRRSLT